MQSEDARMHIFLSRLEYLFRQMCRNFLDKEVLDKNSIADINLFENNVSNQEVFCGTEVELFLSENKIDDDSVNVFKQNAKNFYIQFCEELKKRVNFKDEMLNWFSKFSPDNVIAGKTNSIVPFLLKMFPKEKSKFDLINTQFRALADLKAVKSLKMRPLPFFGIKYQK